MGRISGYYEWDDDGLTPGRKKEGGLHQNLFDDEGKLKGNARFVPADGVERDPQFITNTVYVPIEERRRDREAEELADAIADLIASLAVLGIFTAAPHVHRWWRTSVRPLVNRQWTKLKRANAPRSVVDAESDDEAAPEPNQPPSNDLADTTAQLKMSKAEAQARMLAAIAAQAFADEQMRMVHGAEIVGEANADAVRESISRLPPEIVAELVRRMVTSPSMFEEESLAELASVLAHTDELSNRQLRAAPRDDETSG